MSRAAANTAQAELFDVPRLTDGERRAWRRPPRLSVSQWAEKNYTITDGQFTGPWRNEITPYLVEIMDTWQRPEVRSVSIMAPPQSGKTKVMHICWAYGAAVLSSNSLWVLPDQDSAEETMEELAKAVQDSDSLRALVTGRPRDLSRKRLKLMGATTRSGWSTSPKRLARVSVEHLFCDEKGKWSGYDPNNPEARPAKLARARLTAYPYTRKEMTCSSPTIPGDEISRDVFGAQELRVYMARCPDCGKLQIARVAQLRWDASAETDPDMIESQNLAWYQCEHCESLWSQAKMRLASRTGDFGVFTWDPETSWFDQADPKSAPSSIGFQYGGFYSSFISLGRIAAQAIRAGYRMDPDTGGQQRPTDATRDLDEEHDLYNTLLSLPYKNEEAAREETRILIHCDESRPRGQAPDWCTHLFLTADVRKLGIDYTVRAWRAGPLGRSSLVWAGFVESFEAFEALFRDMSFTDPGGNAVPIHFGLVDSGYKKDETYLLCWNNPPLRPAKGQGERRPPPAILGHGVQGRENRDLPGHAAVSHGRQLLQKQAASENHDGAGPAGILGAARRHQAGRHARPARRLRPPALRRAPGRTQPLGDGGRRPPRFARLRIHADRLRRHLRAE